MKTIFLVFLTSIHCIANAQIMFQKTCAVTGADLSSANSIKQTSDGGYIIAANFKTFLLGDNYVWLLRTTKEGDTLWKQTFGGANDYLRSVQQTSDGGFIAAGRAHSFGAGNDDIYLVKVSPVGNILWEKSYGGSNIEEGYEVQQTTDGGFIVCGITNSFGTGFGDTYLIKTNSNGDLSWAKTYVGADYNCGESVRQTSDGGYITCGWTFASGTGYGDALLIKTNAAGDVQWSKIYAGINDEYLYDVKQTSDGGYIMAGTTTSFGAIDQDIYLIKTDNNGDTLWTRTYGGASIDEANSIQQTNDGGYIIGGWTNSFGAGATDAYLIKTNMLGNLVWSKTFGEWTNEYCYGAQQTSDGGYVLTGSVELTSTNTDVYFIKTDSVGNSGCHETNASTSVNATSTLVLSNIISVFAGGGVMNSNVTSSINSGMITSICTSVGTHDILVEDLITLAPNPFTSQTSITFNEEQKNTTIKIFDILGREIKSIHFSGAQINIEREAMKEGIYFVQIMDEKQHVAVKKIVVQ